MRRYIIAFIIAAVGVTAPTLAMGAEDVSFFFVDSQYEENASVREAAILRAASTHALLFVEQAYYDGRSPEEREAIDRTLTHAGTLFDGRIYEQLRSFLGQEWSPGIDNDGRITIYFTDAVEGVGGYFRAIDQESAYDTPSNRREMIYINAKKIFDPSLPAILSHEFQHLITYNQRTRILGVQDDTWFVEGISEYAATKAGFAEAGDYLRRRAAALKATPNISLIVWGGTPADFAASSLFFHYLADVYGEDIMARMMQSERPDTGAISDALRAMGSTKDFTQAYADWSVALFLNYDADGTGTYAYKNPLLDFLTLHIPARTTLVLGEASKVKTSIALQDFMPQWYRLIPEDRDIRENSSSLRVKFNTLEKDDKFFIPVIATDVRGAIDVSFFAVTGGEGILTVPNFTTELSSVVLLPASHTQTSGFEDAADIFRVLSFDAELSQNPLRLNREGSVVRVRNTPDVYVIHNGFRRWLHAPAIFEGYGHFRWDNVEEVDRAALLQFEESRLIRKAGDYKVYEVAPDGAKRWLDMTPRAFEESGRLWDSVFEVNEKEFLWYGEQ